VAFITTQLYTKSDTDIFIEQTEKNGLKKDSLIRLSKLATLDKKLAEGRMGEITTANINIVNAKLKIIFQL
jgi:mRNA interferase MazF